MIVTVSQYSNLALDNSGNLLPLGGNPGLSQKVTAAGVMSQLSNSTRLIRVASDTPVEMILGGRSIFLPANQPEFFSVGGGETLSVATV